MNGWGGSRSSCFSSFSIYLSHVFGYAIIPELREGQTRLWSKAWLARCSYSEWWKRHEFLISPLFVSRAGCLIDDCWNGSYPWSWLGTWLACRGAGWLRNQTYSHNVRRDTGSYDDLMTSYEQIELLYRVPVSQNLYQYEMHTNQSIYFYAFHRWHTYSTKVSFLNEIVAVCALWLHQSESIPTERS